MSAGLRIGVDFDNTIITYDDVFLSTARERGLVGADFAGRKQAIRDTIRLLPDGELSCLWCTTGSMRSPKANPSAHSAI